MTYTLPFKSSDKIIELGGGENCLYHPNVDVRPGPQTDFTADFNKELPITSEEFDGVFCRFAIEHISWRHVTGFVKECYRILKPGGKAVIITANLLEQAKRLVNAEQFDDDLVCMIFGGNDYPENTHRCGFSPESATRLFQNIGFSEIIILPFGDLRTDMIIEATKPNQLQASITDVNRKLIFNKQYFNGGNPAGGYTSLYGDSPLNWVIFDKIMDYKPTSILELGCGKGYLLKRFEDKGIQVQGVDISPHCHATRVINSIMTWDICDTPWPFADRTFDMCISVATLQYVPVGHLQSVMNEIARVSNRGLHAVETNIDNPFITKQSINEWNKLIPINHCVVSKIELETPKDLIYDYIPPGDGKLKLNIGSFITMFAHGWINIDMTIHNLNLEDFARDNYYKYHNRDVRLGLPFEDDTVDLIYASHFLEYLTYDQGVAFMKECYRAMKQDGVMRLLVHDAELLSQKYLERDLSFFDEISDGVLPQTGKLWSVLFSNHSSIYDCDTLRDLGKLVGFHVEKKSFRKGNAQILAETIDMLPNLSLFVEFTK